MSEWLFGEVSGVPRWMLAVAVVALLVGLRRASRRRRPPDGGNAQPAEAAAKTYRTVRGRAA